MSQGIPNHENQFIVEHIRLLSDSLLAACGCGLIDPGEDSEIAARRLYYAPFALLSHGTESDPLFNYANHTAQQLFEMDWEQIIGLPSRFSAEPVAREERDALLARVTADGFIDDYTGVRIASSGRRFLIEQATVWNVADAQGGYRGQAAMFSLWDYL